MGGLFMKHFFFILLILFSTFSFAETKMPEKSGRKIAQEEIKCGTTIDENVAMIKLANDCYSAMNVAKTCAMGSSGDVSTVVAAQAVCEKDFKKITKDDSALKAKMARRCEKLCDPKNDGTMCLSQIYFCKLSVTEFFAQFYSSEM